MSLNRRFLKTYTLSTTRFYSLSTYPEVTLCLYMFRKKFILLNGNIFYTVLKSENTDRTK